MSSETPESMAGAMTSKQVGQQRGTLTWLLLTVLLFASCGTASRAITASHRATPTPLPTTTPTLPSPTATLPASAPTSTSPSLPTYYDGPIPADPHAVCQQPGAVLSATSALVDETFDGSEEGERLLDTLPLAPQVWTAAINQGRISLTSATTVNTFFSEPPAGQIGYVCGVTVTIEAFQPLATPIPNVIWGCRDESYPVPGGFAPTGDCGAGPLPPGVADVTLVASTVGTTATSAVIDRYLGLPLQPGKEAARVVIHFPQAGVYTFRLTFWQDGSGPTIVAPTITEAISLGQIAHRWGGAACLSAAMQAQLPAPPPAGQPPLQVICPA